MSSLAKVLFIGIDAGDKDLIWRWAESGDLPNLRELFHTGAWGTTHNPVGLYVGAVWPSFYTALSPARHARYCHRQFVPGSYRIKRVSPRDVEGEPFWDALDRRDKRVAVIDVPKTAAGHLVNGIHIVDWATHDPDRAGFVAWPGSEAPFIEEQFGRDCMHNCNAFRLTGEEYRDFRDGLIDRVRKKTDLSAWYLEKGGWDCFLTVYGESHCVGHQCWHLHDHGHPKHDHSFVEVAGNPIKDVYRAIDDGIGRLVRTAGGDCRVVVFASHGMGPHYDATFMLDRILRRLEGLPAPREKREWTVLPPSLYAGAPERVRKLARRLDNKVTKALRLDEDAGRARRMYFPVPNNDVYGGIRINVVGREPRGLVHPGREYDACCENLAEDLMAFTNTTTGEPLVNAVLKSTDLYDGENVHCLPDLLVEWNRNSPVTEVFSPRTGLITGEYRKCRTGDHTASGLFVMTGPSIPPGPLETPISVMDLAPTIASFVDVRLDGVDGKPLTAPNPRRTSGDR